MMNATLIQFLKILNDTFDKVFARYRMLLIVGSHLGLVAFANVLSFLFRFEGVIPQSITSDSEQILYRRCHSEFLEIE